MRSLSRLVVLALAVAVFGGAAMANGHVAVPADIPVMPGLTVAAESVTIFEQPAGRIVTVEARGPVPLDAADRFYADSLAALGWRRASHGLTSSELAQGRLERDYERDGERLSLVIRGDAADLAVSLSITPGP